MKGVHFEGATFDLVKPENMTDDECGSLPAMSGTTEDGYPYILVAFKPSPEDIKAMINDGKLFLRVLGTQFAPVVLFTIDSEGIINPM